MDENVIEYETIDLTEEAKDKLYLALQWPEDYKKVKAMLKPTNLHEIQL